MYETLEDMREQGYNVDKLTPTHSKNDIVWDSENNQFVLVYEDGTTYTGTTTDATSDKSKMWKVYTEIPTESEYSIYYSGTTSVETVNANGVGFDAGNASVKTINYTNTTGTAKNVVLRTNGGIINVNAPLDTVTHYGKTDNVMITAVADDSYHENGEVKNNIVISAGRVVVENKAEVKEVKVVNATKEVKVETNIEVVICVDESSKEKTNIVANAEDVKVSGVSSDKISGSQSSKVVQAVEINSTETLKDAILKSGFYKISSDFTLSEAVTVDKNAKVIIDFNGKTITYGGNWLFTIEGDLTLMDSVGTGKIKAGKGVFSNLGILTINGCTIETTVVGSGAVIRNGIDLSGNLYSESKLIINNVLINSDNNYAIVNTSYFELNGGEINCTSSSKNGEDAYGYCISNTNTDYAKFVANGGVITGIQGAISINSGTAIINDVSAITNNSEGYKDSCYALYVAGETDKTSCVVNGGYFSAGERAALYVGNNSDGGDGNLALCTINGGTFISPSGVSCLHQITESEDNYGLGYITINGGKFSTDVSKVNGVNSCQKESNTGLYVVNG